MGKDNTKRLFIDHYCLGVLGSYLNLDDFKAKKLDKITVIDKNKEFLKNLEQVTEEIALFIIQPIQEIFNVVIEANLILKALRSNLTINIVFVPCENYDIIEYMTTNDLLINFNIFSLNIDLLPIDTDILSLERESSLQDIYIDNNLSSVSELANSFVKLETCYGKVKHKYIKGDYAQIFDSIVQEKEKENDLKTNDEILGMIVLDRSVDFLSLMLTNYTFEGLIDENFDINFGIIKVKESILKENLTKAPITGKREINVPLTSQTNDFYCRIRCMHYTDAKGYIETVRQYYQKLALLSKDSKVKLSLDELKVLTDELGNYMKNVKEPLIKNSNLVEYCTKFLDDPSYLKYIEKEQLMLAGDVPDNLHSYYDDHLYEQRDLNSLIKLMVVESLTQGGVQDYQKIKREILNIYGFQKIFLFRDLEKLGWLKEKTVYKKMKNMIDISYNQIRDKLELINFDYNPKKIVDCSYVAGGFCPISLRLVERALEGKWGKISDTLKRMPGALIYPQNESVFKEPIKDKNIIFIVFVGGITYTEIEGIRFLNRKLNEEYLNKKREKKTQLIIITTSILNHKKILQRLGKEIHSSLSMKQFYEQSKK